MDDEEKREKAKEIANQILNLGTNVKGSTGLFSKGGIVGGIMSNVGGLLGAAEKLPEVLEKLKEAGFDIDVGSNIGGATHGGIHSHPRKSFINNTTSNDSYKVKCTPKEKGIENIGAALAIEIKYLKEQREELLGFKGEGISVDKALEEIDIKIKNVTERGAQT